MSKTIPGTPPSGEASTRAFLSLVSLLEQEDAYPIFVTGAGISLASGIPTFRGSDPDAVWSNSVFEMGTLRKFYDDPVAQWQWYLSRFEACLGCEPNPGHRALAQLETLLQKREAHFHILTQNVDGLHIAAGSENVTEIHGAARKMRCSMNGCEHGAFEGFLPWDPEAFAAFKADPVRENIPTCPSCGHLVRAHVLWFDEMYDSHDDYGMDGLVSLLADTTVVVFVGTSFSVGITSMVIGAARDLGLTMYTIDPNLTPDRMVGHLEGINLIQGASETVLPELFECVEMADMMAAGDRHEAERSGPPDVYTESVLDGDVMHVSVVQDGRILRTTSYPAKDLEVE